MATLYAAKGGNTASNLYTLDPNTGAETSIGPTGFALTGLAFDPTSGTLYGATSNSSPSHPVALITIDTGTGAGTLVADFSDGGPIADICFDNTGQLYGWTENTDDFVIIDKANGNVTIPADSAQSSFGDGLDVNPLDGKLYAFPKGASWSSGSLGSWTTYFTINTTTGALTTVGVVTGGPVNSNPAIAAASFDSLGACWQIWNDVPTRYLVTVDVGTGVATSVATLSGSGWDALAWSPGAATLHANFTGTPLLGRLPLTVNFTDHSNAGPGGAITSWSWDFGDSGTSSSQNPSHVYTTPGTYTVSLTVTSPDGTDTRTRTSYVSVKEPQILYAAIGSNETTSDLYTVDPDTAVMTSIGPIGFALTGLAFDPTDATLYGMTSNHSAANPQSLITIDVDTGAGTLVGSLGTLHSCNDIAFDATGNLYGWEAGSGTFVHFQSIDKTTGAATAVGSSNTSLNGGGLDFKSDGTLYLVGDNNNRKVTTINVSTGFPTGGAFTSPLTYLNSGKFDNLDVFWGPSNNNDLYKINVPAGTATYVAALSPTPPDLVDAMAWSVPSTTPDFLLSLSPNPLTVAPGSSDTTTVSAFAFNSDTESIIFSDSGAPSGVTLNYGTNPITAGGSSVITVNVGGGVANGVYHITITGTGDDNTHTTSLTLRVTPGTSINLNPNTGPCNTEVSVSGSGFSASSTLHISFDGTDYFVTGTTATDSSGNFSGSLFVTGEYVAGVYVVTVTDDSGLSASANFTIIVPTFAMTPTSANNSKVINLQFTGSSWPASTLLEVAVNLGSGRIGGGGTQVIDIFEFKSEDPPTLAPLTITSGSMTTDSSGNFDVTIQIPKHIFPSGTWEIYVLVASDPPALGFLPPTCSSDHHTLTICSSGTFHDDTDLAHDPVLVGHSTQDWAATHPGGSNQIAATVGGHTYIIQENYGTVKCGDNFYSAFRVTPESANHGALPIPSWYHILMVYEVAADGSSSNYYFVDPLPYYSFGISSTGFADSNEWSGNLSLDSWNYQFFHAQIVTDGTNVWVGIIEAASKDYPYISANDGHNGNPDQLTQVLARGNLASLVAQKTANSSVTWPVHWHDQIGTIDLHTPRPPDSDSGDSYSGTYAQGQLAVYHFNGSNFDRLGAVDAKYNWLRGIGSEPLMPASYLSGVAACASPAEPGVAHFVWSEGGAWGRRFDGVLGGSYFVWDSDQGGGFFNSYGLGNANLDYRMNYSRWDASGKILDNDLKHSHTDRSNRYTLTSGGTRFDPVYVSTEDMACSNLVELHNEHGSPIAIVSPLQMDYRIYDPYAPNGADALAYVADFYGTDIRFWDISSGAVNELQVMNSSVLPQIEEVQSRVYNTPSTGINRINISPILGDYYRSHNNFPQPDIVQGNDGLGAHGLYSSTLYEDPLLGGQPVYLISTAFINTPIIGGEDTNSVGFFRIPCDGSAPFTVMDGHRYTSILPNPTVYGYGIYLSLENFFSDPRNVWVPLPGSASGATVGFGVGGGLLQLDRVCDEGWKTIPYAHGTTSGLGYLYAGGTMTGGSGNVPVWSDWDRTHFWWDGENTFYLSGIWLNSDFPTPSAYGGIGTCIIRRGSIPCCTITTSEGKFIRIHTNGDVQLIEGDFKIVKINTDGSVNVVDATNFAQIQIFPDGTVKRSA